MPQGADTYMRPSGPTARPGSPARSCGSTSDGAPNRIGPWATLGADGSRWVNAHAAPRYDIAVAGDRVPCAGFAARAEASSAVTAASATAATRPDRRTPDGDLTLSPATRSLTDVSSRRDGS